MLEATERVISAPWIPTKGVAPIDRLMERVSLDVNGCWLVPVQRNPRYGLVRVDGKNALAHRVSYEYFRGKIQEGLTVDHLCRVTNCINPWHMEIVTMGENVLRGNSISAQNARKTHCKHGHEFTEENTYWEPRGRQCKTCKKEFKQSWLAIPENREREKERHRRYKARKRAERAGS